MKRLLYSISYGFNCFRMMWNEYDVWYGEKQPYVPPTIPIEIQISDFDKCVKQPVRGVV